MKNYSIVYEHTSLGWSRAWFDTHEEAQTALARWRQNPTMLTVDDVETHRQDLDASLAEYEAWATGERSEISELAMTIGREQAVRGDGA